MDTLDRLFKEATGFHKATCLLASKFTGIKYYDAEEHLSFPMMFRVSDKELHRTVFSDADADKKWKGDADSYFTALIVNGAFSLELHLKYLHCLIKGKFVYGHDLSRLFQVLPEDSQANLETEFQAISASQPLIKRSFDLINKAQGIARSWSLQTVLQESAKAFESWRYCFEGKFKSSSFAGYGEAIYVMRKMANQYRNK